jgi:hypothetical protein
VGHKASLAALGSWRTSTNLVGNTRAFELLGATELDGHAVLVVEQAPADYSLGVWKTTHYILPERGFVAMRTVFSHPESGAIIREVENSRITEIADGIWRPLERRDVRYRWVDPSDTDGPTEVNRITTIRFETAPHVNVEVTPLDFDTAPPPGMTRIVDRTAGEQVLDMESPAECPVAAVDAASTGNTTPAEEPAAPVVAESPSPPSPESVAVPSQPTRAYGIAWAAVGVVIVAGVVWLVLRKLPAT